MYGLAYRVYSEINDIYINIKCLTVDLVKEDNFQETLLEEQVNIEIKKVGLFWKYCKIES